MILDNVDPKIDWERDTQAYKNFKEFYLQVWMKSTAVMEKMVKVSFGGSSGWMNDISYLMTVLFLLWLCL